MINLEVDEAFAFDYLAILYVKMTFAPSNEQNNINYEKCYNSLLTQIDEPKLLLVLNSKEYDDLITANRILFDTIEEIRNDDNINSLMSARTLDNLNSDRWRAKKTLQQKFFGQITESKTIE